MIWWTCRWDPASTIDSVQRTLDADNSRWTPLSLLSSNQQDPFKETLNSPWMTMLLKHWNFDQVRCPGTSLNNKLRIARMSREQRSSCWRNTGIISNADCTGPVYTTIGCSRNSKQNSMKLHDNSAGVEDQATLSLRNLLIRVCLIECECDRLLDSWRCD